MDFIALSLVVGFFLLEAHSKATLPVVDKYCNCSQKPSDDYPICGEIEGVTMSFRGSIDLQCHTECRDADITILYNGGCEEENNVIPEDCSCDEKPSDADPMCGLLNGRRKSFRGSQDLQCYASCTLADITILHDGKCRENQYYDQDNNLIN